MKTDVFRGKQPIFSTEEVGTATVTLSAVESGKVAFSSVMSVSDSFMGLLESADGVDWELSTCTLASTAPDVYSRSLIKSSTGALVAFTNTATLSSVAVGGSLLPNAGGFIELNDAVLKNGLLYTDASGGTNLAAGAVNMNISTRRIIHCTLYGNVNPFNFTNFNSNLRGCEIKMIFEQDEIGGRTITYGSSFTKIGTSTLNTAAYGTTLATFLTFDNGSSWWYNYN